MIKEYYHDIDMNANQLFNSRLHNITTAARIILGGTLSTSDKGYMVYDTDLSSPYFWDGTQWLAAGGGGGTWGTITGTLTAQTDLTLYLSTNYYPLSSNPANYITAAALSPYLTSSTAASTYEPIISAGTTSQYWRGDKTWQTFPTIPAAQIQSDWNQTNNTLLDYIKNKPTIPTVTPSALTKTDDTNVTLTLGGSPSTALLAATSLTLGWTGTLADSRIASASTWNAKVGGNGTQNYVPKWFITGSTLTDSQIFDNGSYVAIGTTTIGAGVTNTSNFGTNKEIYAYGGFNVGSVGSSAYIQTGMYRASVGNAVDFWAGNAIIANYNYVGGGIGDSFTIQDAYNTGISTGIINTLKITGSIGNIAVANNVEYNQINISPSYSQLSPNPFLVPLGTGTIRGIYYNPTVGNINGSPHIAYQNTSGDIIHGNLATGGADKMVTVDTSGKLKTQTIPTGGGGITHATASGTDTYTATITGVTSYTDGDAYIIQFTNGNTTSCTLNINSIGDIPLYRNNDSAIIGGDIQANGEMICVYDATVPAFRCIGTSPNTLLAYVTNADSVTITKGQPVYAFGGTGDRMTVKLAYNTGDSTSAQTVGLVYTSSIAANQKGFIIIQGLLDGLSILPTSTWADGDAVYLGSTAGSITPTKQYAPNHLVYLGFVTTASNGSAGRMYVRVQNGYELDELHNVQAQTPSLNDTLYYDNAVSPAQWKTASIPTILGYAPQSFNQVQRLIAIGI